MDATPSPNMGRIPPAIAALVLVTMVLATVAVGVAVLVFGSYGCGLVLSRLLPFSLFEATVVSLLALMPSILVVIKAASALHTSLKAQAANVWCETCGCYHWKIGHDEDEEEEEEDLTPNDGLRAALFVTGAIKPNAPCPCGSGRRYSKCCGDGRLFRQRRAGPEAGSP